MKAYKAIDVAQFVLDYYKMEDRFITHLGLQNILFFIQWYYLKNYNRDCFSDKIEVWDDGPIVPKILNECKNIFKKFGISQYISYPIGDSSFLFTQDKQILKIVVARLIDYPVWYLTDMTNKKGGAWDRAKSTKQEEISSKLLRDDNTISFDFY